jgi:hypothetical protein
MAPTALERWPAVVPVFLSEAEAARLLEELKPLPTDWRERLELRPKRGHSERELDVAGVDGSQFRVILRQSQLNAFDFSAIIGWRPDDSTRVIRLRRYNGRSHRHTNKLEREQIEGFHIHILTERYQQSGFREDSYATATDRYGTLQEALACLISDCNLVPPPEDQLDLLDVRTQ